MLIRSAGEGDRLGGDDRARQGVLGRLRRGFDGEHDRLDGRLARLLVGVEDVRAQQVSLGRGGQVDGRQGGHHLAVPGEGAGRGAGGLPDPLVQRAVGRLGGWTLGRLADPDDDDPIRADAQARPRNDGDRAGFAGGAGQRGGLDGGRERGVVGNRTVGPLQRGDHHGVGLGGGGGGGGERQTSHRWLRVPSRVAVRGGGRFLAVVTSVLPEQSLPSRPGTEQRIVDRSRRAGREPRRLPSGPCLRRNPTNPCCTPRCTPSTWRWARRWAPSAAGTCRSPTPAPGWSPSTPRCAPRSASSTCRTWARPRSPAPARPPS